MRPGSRTRVAALALVVLLVALAVAVSMRGRLAGLLPGTSRATRPAEEARPPAPDVPAAIGPGGSGPVSSHPSYSPDGREVAFWTSWRGNQPDVWVVSTRDGRLRPLAADPGVAESEPAWAPNGSWVAFASSRAGGPNIWLVRPDGSGLTQLTTGSATDDEPVWSPDSTRIAFVSDRAGERNIWMVNVNGTGLRRLTTQPCCQNSPSFSPDGSRIVFYQTAEARAGAGSISAGSNLWIINVDGSGLRQLTTGTFDDASPSWGTEGIIFESNRTQPDGTRAYAIWTIQPDGSGLRVFPNSRGLDPTWSPDGTRFAVGSGGIREFSISTNRARPLVQLRGYFIAIDIKPGDAPKSINLKSKGRIPVAILSGPDPFRFGLTFNPVERIDRATPTFGRTGDEHSLVFCAADEINGDGIPDLVCHFETELTGFQPGDTEGILRAMDTGRIRFEGRGPVRIVP